MDDTESMTRSFAGLSRASRLVVVVAATLVGVVVAGHLNMVFFHVAPKNAISSEYSGAIDGYIRPEFAQNWKLFAPEPLHVNRDMYVRAEVRGAGGAVEVTDWINITDADVEHTRGNLVPSHTRNHLRKGWRTYLNTHDERDQPTNVTGQIIQDYLKRMALLRLSSQLEPETIVRIQLRVDTTRVPEPEWSPRTTTAEPTTRELPWWPVSAGDFPLDSGG